MKFIFVPPQKLCDIMIDPSFTGIGFVYDLQCVREIMPSFVTSLISLFSGELFYLAFPITLIALFYWVIDKKSAHLVGLSVSASMLFYYCIKNYIRQPRPWLLDERIIPSLEAVEDSYSFPSGHTSIATSAYLSSAFSFSEKYRLSDSLRVRRISIAASAGFVILTFLIAFSRMYVGNHTPLDVICGFVLATAIVFVTKAVLRKCYDTDKRYYAMMTGYAVIACMATVIMFYLECPFKYCSAFGGLAIAFIAGACADRRFIRYEIPDVSVNAKTGIFAAGIVCVIMILAFCKLCLPDAISYLSIGVLASFWITVVYPLAISGFVRYAKR